MHITSSRGRALRSRNGGCEVRPIRIRDFSVGGAQKEEASKNDTCSVLFPAAVQPSFKKTKQNKINPKLFCKDVRLKKRQQIKTTEIPKVLLKKKTAGDFLCGKLLT